jgi:aminoglycoside phosphotransferase (APT) family kinase protein
LVRSTADAIRSLHSIDTGAFSSRLDGSPPQFEQWSGCLRHRFDQVRERCASVDAADSVTLDRAGVLIHRLADAVSPHARPTVCHRDLHVDNLLVSDEGMLVGVIDWDAAESWDPAVPNAIASGAQEFAARAGRRLVSLLE